MLDSSGNGNDGTLTNGAVRDPSGYYGQSIVTDGVAGNVDLGGLDVDSGEITLMAWINADDYGTSDARILSKSTGSNEGDHIFMLSTLSGPYLRFRLSTLGSTTTLVGNTGGTIPTGTWFHAAATYDGATMRLYHNAVQVGSTGKTGAVDTDPGVAAWIAANPGEPNQVFDGRIDEVKIFRTALSAVEIQTQMDTPVVPPTPTATPTPTPEPGAMLQLVAGGVGLVFLNKRRLRKNRRAQPTGDTDRSPGGIVNDA